MKSNNKIGLILMYIGISLISFGIGWIIGEKVIYAINKEICSNTTNLKWFVDNNCVDYFIDEIER